MMPGLMQLTRAPRSPQVTAAACTRRGFACLEIAYAAPEFGTASGARTGSASNSSTGVKARACAVSGSSGGGMWPAMLEMCTPAPPGAMPLPNSSRTTAVPKRSTASTASAGACTGETPAVLTTWTTSPRPAAASARTRTDSASDTSTRWVVTVWPASSSAVFAFCRVVSLKSASSTCLPAPVRRAMACPMLPAPMTTWTAVFVGMLMVSRSRLVRRARSAFDEAHLRLVVVSAGGRGEGVELRDLRRRQLEVVGGEVLLQPGQPLGAGDGGDVIALRQQPRQGDLGGGGAGLVGDRLHLVGDGEVAPEVLAGETRVGRPEVVRSEVALRPDGAGQEPVAERRVGDQADAELPEQRQRLLLVAGPQRVLRLQRGDRVDRVCAAGWCPPTPRTGRCAGPCPVAPARRPRRWCPRSAPWGRPGAGSTGRCGRCRAGAGSPRRRCGCWPGCCRAARRCGRCGR